MPKLTLKKILYVYNYKTSLLRRLQAQTLPNATPPVDKIQPIQQNRRNFWTNTAILMPFKNLWKNVNIVCFMTGSIILNRLGVTVP